MILFTLNNRVEAVTQTGKSYTAQGKDSTANEQRTASRRRTAIGVAGVAGAISGVATADHALKNYVRSNLEKEGWFEALRKIQLDKLEAAGVNTILGNDLSGDVSRLNDAVRSINAEYQVGCEKVMAERGISSWAGRWRRLEASQKNKTLAFAACAAVTVGGISYLLTRGVQGKISQVIDNVENGLAPAR